MIVTSSCRVYKREGRRRICSAQTRVRARRQVVGESGWEFRRGEEHRMRNLTLLWLLAYAMTPSAFAWAAGNTSAESWVGCYELRVAPDDAKKELWGRIPRRFELLVSPWGEPSNGEQWFNIRSLDPGPILEGEFWFDIKSLDTPQDWLISVWTPKSDDEMSIGIGNGFVGYDLKIKKNVPFLVGTARPTSDDGMTHIPFPIKLARVACK
jgi:hypothetical protein